MRQMFSLKQLLNLIASEGVEAVKRAIESGEIQVGGVDALAPEYDATATYKAGDMVIYEDALYQAKADINTAEAWDSTHWDEATIIPDVRKFLNEKFVRIMDAPTGDLTQEQMSIIKEGVFIQGDWLGFHNPVVEPLTPYGNGLIGVIKGQEKNNYWYKEAGITIGSTGHVSLSPMSQEIIAKNIYQGATRLFGKSFPNYPADTAIGQLICRKGNLRWYSPVEVTGITSGDVVALDSDLGKALLDHLEVEINGHRCRYERTNGNYVVYSWKDEADSGVNLEINMISYNTTNGELSFNVMKFAPIV